MFNKSHAIMAAIIATTQLVRAEEFMGQEQHPEYYENQDEGRNLKASLEAIDAQGIFSLFDINQDGNIKPTEITEAYNAMDTNDNDNLKQNELLKSMDSQIRSFCGVGPASEAEVQAEQDEQDEQDQEDSDQKPRNRRNRGDRSNNRNARNRRSRNSDDEDQDQQSNLGMTYGDEEDFDQDDDEFSDDEGGRRLRENARGGNSRRGTWNNSQARNGNNSNSRSRNNRNSRSRNQNNKRSGKKNKRSRVSRKSLARKRMAKGLFGIIDSNNNSKISLKEMFKPFAAADSNYDMNVSLAEFNNMISKGKKPICKQYKVKARKQAFKSWYEMGTENQKGSN